MLKASRNTYKVFMNVGTKEVPEWELLGKDIEDLSRELNNEVNSFTNILGETEVEITKGVNVTTVEPVKFRDGSKASKILYEIYKYDKELSDVEYEFLEVNTTEEITTEEGVSTSEYGAFRQIGAIDLKSWGGDKTGINSPFDINWLGEKTYGTFNPTSKTFTPEE